MERSASTASWVWTPALRRRTKRSRRWQRTPGPRVLNSPQQGTELTSCRGSHQPETPMSSLIYRSDAAREQIYALYDRAVTALPFPTTSRMIPTRFGDTHVLPAGPETGRPVVVFQGGNVVNPLTLAWFARLTDRFRISAPDTIGQPGKSVGERVSANDASLGEWAVDVFDGLGLTSAPVVGISYGAGRRPRLRRPRLAPADP